MAFVIDSEKCVGCGACALFCLFRSVKASDENASKYYIREHHCMECGQCIDVCPNSAISAPENFRKISKVYINKQKCIGCSSCMHQCPAKAPFGEMNSPFEIDQSKCFQCGACARKCIEKAIEVEYAI